MAANALVQSVNSRQVFEELARSTLWLQHHSLRSRRNTTGIAAIQQSFAGLRRFGPLADRMTLRRNPTPFLNFLQYRRLSQGKTETARAMTTVPDARSGQTNTMYKSTQPRTITRQKQRTRASCFCYPSPFASISTGFSNYSAFQ